MEKQYYKPLPECVTIKDSGIHGLGLFATKEIQPGTRIGRTHMKTEDPEFEEDGGWIRFPLGGFFNHSETPNCKVTHEGIYIFLDVLDKVIQPGDEILVTYTLYDPTK
jgi:SET domain-containing protein